MRLLICFLSLCVLSRVLGAESKLHLLCWSEYVPPEVVKRFEETRGTKVLVETYDSNEQMLAKLRERPNYYDLIQPSGFYVEKLAAASQLESLQQVKLPGLANLDPAYLHLPFERDGRFAVPWLSGTVGIVVNTELVQEQIDSWTDVFSGKYARRIVVVDDAREMVAWALASLGLPLTDVSDAALSRVEPVLKRWLPQVAIFDAVTPATALRDGRADVGILWSGEAAILLRESNKYRYILPRAGAHRFVDCLAIPKGAPHPDQAHRFIEFCLDPQVSLLISRAYPYTNPNLAARRLLSEEERTNPASYPAGHEKLPMLRNDGNDAGAVFRFVARLRRELPEKSQ